MRDFLLATVLLVTGIAPVAVHAFLTPNTNYSFSTWTALKFAVEAWCSDESAATAIYGDINTWDVSLVSDMSWLFGKYSNSNGTVSSCGTTFNSDISNWNTGQCTTMKGMFYHAEAFNQDISQWWISRVVMTDMSSMFYGASVFNQNISQWDVDRVETMQSMFMYASAFNQVLCWKLSSVRVTNTDNMFTGSSGSLAWIGNNGACVFLPPGRSELQTALRSWAADSAHAASIYGHIRTWNTSQITDMSSLFYTEATYDDWIDDDNGEPDFSSFNDNIDSWDVSSVTNMG